MTAKQAHSQIEVLPWLSKTFKIEDGLSELLPKD